MVGGFLLHFSRRQRAVAPEPPRPTANRYKRTSIDASEIEKAFVFQHLMGLFWRIRDLALLRQNADGAPQDAAHEIVARSRF
jgi:hypothetical protein